MTDNQVAKWKAALAELHKRQRQQRGRRRVQDASSTGPGMIRIPPRRAEGQPSTEGDQGAG